MILDLDILVKDLDLVLFFILDIKTEKIIEKCVEKCVETANYYTTTRWHVIVLNPINKNLSRFKLSS